jgi:hypothetical protein
MNTQGPVTDGDSIGTHHAEIILEEELYRID